MTDEQLLQRAARAMGWVSIADTYDPVRGIQLINWTWWNPFTDRIAAMNMMIQLGMSVDTRDRSSRTPVTSVQAPGGIYIIEEHGHDNYAATLRAIVRCAAMIGDD